MSLLVKQIFDEVECEEIFNFLDTIKVEYHKEYKGMYGRMMKVPRGQASFTLNTNIHYDYKVSGGSPPNTVMCDTLKMITQRVNEKLGTNFNTILMNVYKEIILMNQHRMTKHSCVDWRTSTCMYSLVR